MRVEDTGCLEANLYHYLETGLSWEAILSLSGRQAPHWTLHLYSLRAAREDHEQRTSGAIHLGAGDLWFCEMTLPDIEINAFAQRTRASRLT